MRWVVSFFGDIVLTSIFLQVVLDHLKEKVLCVSLSTTGRKHWKVIDKSITSHLTALQQSKPDCDFSIVNVREGMCLTYMLSVSTMTYCRLLACEFLF